MGKLSRIKGKVFERQIATRYRKRWPTATIRRALQSEKAYEPDVVVEGFAPDKAISLWTECEDSRTPDPAAKMRQATRDISRAVASGRRAHYIPIVVWHLTGRRRRNVTLRLSDFLVLLERSPVGEEGTMLIQMDFDEFLSRVLPAV